jgi:hypothetical protein
MDPTTIITNIVTDPATFKMIKDILSEYKSNYGKVQLLFTVGIDFSEPLRVDDLKNKLTKILTDEGFKKGNGEFILEDVLSIKDIHYEPLFLQLLRSEDEEDDDNENEEDDISNKLILIKRLRIYAIPKSEKLSHASLKLAKIIESFSSYTIKKDKYFIILVLIFDDTSKATKFKKGLEERFKKERLPSNNNIRQIEKQIEIIIESITETTKIFNVIEDHLFKKGLKNILTTLK